jgi:formyl-CoA transferase
MKARAAKVDEVDETISAWTREHTREALMAMLNGADVFCGIVKELPEVMTDPHLHARGMLREVDDPRLGRITMWTSPLRMNAEAPMPQSFAPALGADSDEFLRTELGLDTAAIASLRERKII